MESRVVDFNNTFSGFNMIVELKLERISFLGDETIPCVLSYEKNFLDTSLYYYDHELGKLIFNGQDLFSALKEVREFLESKGFLLLCAGSMPNTYPSRMSRQMSNGRKAYLHTFGTKPNSTDVIDIFAPVDASKIGSVKDQENYMKRWYGCFEK